MEIHIQHEKDKHKISDQLKSKPQNALPVVLDHQKNLSYTLRENRYRQFYSPLNISHFSRVISVDSQRRVAFVEPGVSMEQLVNATLPYGLIPPVIPEFKGISVGGAVMGGAFESGSFRFGQFNDTCVSYEILLGDGSIIRASPDEYQDLFYGVAGSYGSLGVLLGAEVALIPARHDVVLHYHRFQDLSKAIDFFAQKYQEKRGIQFLEGIIYQPNEITVIEGKLTSLEYNYPKQTYREHWSRWFFQHVRETAHDQEILPLKDYLFRHDRAALWMGCYILHPALLSRFFLAKAGAHWRITETEATEFQKICYPGSFNRFFFGWLLTSKLLFSLLHSGRDSEEWIADRFIIQNFYIPVEKAADFIEYVLQKCRITPLRLCPIKSTTSPQIFSPHYQPNLNRGLLIDIGVYGYQKDSVKLTEELENLAVSLGGKKLLYGYSYYSEEEFWKIYSRDEYQKLRQTYHAENAWLSIEKKVLKKFY